MRTEFTAAQLTDPVLDEANSILRKCVHCGFCNSTCPTFKLIGDELDGPRGRIYLLKKPAGARSDTFGGSRETYRQVPVPACPA